MTEKNNDGSLNNDLRSLKQELEFRLNDFDFEINSASFNAYKTVIEASVICGKMSREAADIDLEDAEDYFLGIPEAHFRLKNQKDDDGWLRQWLIKHPEFFEDDTKFPNWPLWLPRSQDSD